MAQDTTRSTPARPMTRPSRTLFLVAPPGLEAFVAEEVAELAETRVDVVPGGVRLTGDLADAAGLALWSRTAVRVLVELGEVPAPSLQALGAAARQLPWQDVAVPGQQIEASVTLKQARIRRPDAVAARVAQAAQEALRGPRKTARRPPSPLKVTVRVHGKRATISADAGGGLLHKRGYRKASAKAPIRETLAASLLRAADWHLDEPLADPMCGSGTFLIEAAWMLQDRAPGRGRRPPVVSWPAFPKRLWQRMEQEAGSPLAQPSTVLWGRDRDPGALKATRSNAERAGVGSTLSLHHGLLKDPWPQLPDSPGLVILNPPYGVRVADRSRINGLYDAFGRGLRSTFPNWRLAVITPRPELARRLTPEIEEITTFKNGGLNVGFYGGVIPTG